MKKIVLASIVIMLFVGCGATQINPSPSNSNLKIQDEFQYQKGYNDAIQKEKDRWIAEGYTNALNIVKKYKNEILSYEAGKFALKNQFVTYPKIIASSDDGQIKLKSLGCEIKKSMNIDDIFHYYGKNAEMLIHDNNSLSKNINSKSNDEEITLGNVFNGGIFIEPATSNTTNANNQKNTIVAPVKSGLSILSLPKNQKSRDNINKFGLDCTENSSGYNCQFTDEQEKSWFCKETGICK